jgi:hypothetical protein
MMKIANVKNAKVTEKKPDCCTALRGRKNLDVQAHMMVADPDGCE